MIFTHSATLDMKLPVDGLFFIGMQLVAISNTGKVAVWQSVQRHWQLQDVEPICSYDAAGSFLLLGCTNGSIYYIGENEWGGMDSGPTSWNLIYVCMLLMKTSECNGIFVVLGAAYSPSFKLLLRGFRS